ncbi:MAG: endo alpha-1,4 polygalactosaminidase [Solirubrobacterales bacterium]
MEAGTPRTRPVALILAAATLATLALLLAPAGAGAVGGVPGTRHWQPPPRTSAWQWQLQGKIDPTVRAWAYDVDGFEASKGDVRALHRHRRRAICYLDVGSWESFRPDADRFPPAVIGRAYPGFPDERWLDVSRFGLFAEPLEARIQMCARKRFDAVEPDNVAGWENRTGFQISRGDQLRFNRWIAAQVHARGMAVALKNDPRQVRQLVGDFDFAIVEECFQYDECGFYEPFIDRGKAVFEAEYELEPDEFCAAAEALGFSAIRKSYDLFAKPWEPCDPLAAGAS